MLMNRMKARIENGAPALGLSVMFPSAHVVEMAGLLGFDWVLIDCEHGSITIESVELMALAAERRGVTPIVRPESNRPELIAKYLDRGCMGVQVPHIRTVADARAAVAAARFHPAGDRGLARGTRLSDYGYAGDSAEFVASANRQTLVCLQIEDREAVDNLDEILDVQGVDVFFVGPSDLSQSLGYPNQREHPVVARAIQSAFEKIRAAGKAPGAPATSENAARLAQSGVLYLYTHFQNVFAAGAAAFLGAAGPTRHRAA